TERDVDGYVAVPLQAADGTVLGLISAFDRRPMPEEPRRLFILRIFAARATAELLRLRAEQRLSEREVRYRGLFEKAPIRDLDVGPDLRIPHQNPRMAQRPGT